MSATDNPDGEQPKRPRRKRVDADDQTPDSASDTASNIPPDTPDESAAESPAEPKPSTRKRASKVDADAAQPEEVARRPRRQPAEKKKAEPVSRKKAAKPSAKPKAVEPAEKRKGPPKGRVSRAIWLARMFIRYAPIWVLVVLLLLIFGPALLRAIRPPDRVVRIASFFTPEVQHWAPQIIRWSQEYGVDANLIATLMQIESCGYPGAASQVGAQGLFQVMPINFKPSDNMTDPDTNAERGIGVIRDCLRWANNDVGLAMACYNGGPSLIYAPPSSWPAETQRYYTWGGGIFNDTQRGVSRSETLDNWLTAGGIGLCQQAALTLGIATPVLNIVPSAVPSAVPATPIPVLPTLAVVPTSQAPLPTVVQPGVLPTFPLYTDTPAPDLALTPPTSR